MIDFTTIQQKPIPLSILELQEINDALITENQSLQKNISGRNIFLGILFISSIVIGIVIYQNQKDERNKN